MPTHTIICKQCEKPFEHYTSSWNKTPLKKYCDQCLYERSKKAKYKINKKWKKENKDKIFKHHKPYAWRYYSCYKEWILLKKAKERGYTVTDIELSQAKLAGDQRRNA